MIIPPQPEDVVAWVTVRLHAAGTVSTQGTIYDKRQAMHLLEVARDAIKRQVKEPGSAIVIPNHEIDVAPSIPVREMGMMPVHERGDP